MLGLRMSEDLLCYAKQCPIVHAYYMQYDKIRDSSSINVLFYIYVSYVMHSIVVRKRERREGYRIWEKQLTEHDRKKQNDRTERRICWTITGLIQWAHDLLCCTLLHRWAGWERRMHEKDKRARRADCRKNGRQETSEEKRPQKEQKRRWRE